MARGSAGWDDEFRTRVSVFRGFDWIAAGGRADCRRGVQSGERRTVFRAARGRRVFEWKTDSCFGDRQTFDELGGDRFSDAQTRRQREHSLLLAIHAAVARGAARRFRGARFVLGGLRAIRGVLGIWVEVVGYGGGNFDGAGSGREGYGFVRRSISRGRAGHSGLE